MLNKIRRYLKQPDRREQIRNLVMGEIRATQQYEMFGLNIAIGPEDLLVGDCLDKILLRDLRYLTQALDVMSCVTYGQHAPRVKTSNVGFVRMPWAIAQLRRIQATIITDQSCSTYQIDTADRIARLLIVFEGITRVYENLPSPQGLETAHAA